MFMFQQFENTIFSEYNIFWQDFSRFIFLLKSYVITTKVDISVISLEICSEVKV